MRAVTMRHPLPGAAPPPAPARKRGNATHGRVGGTRNAAEAGKVGHERRAHREVGEHFRGVGTRRARARGCAHFRRLGAFGDSSFLFFARLADTIPASMKVIPHVSPPISSLRGTRAWFPKPLASRADAKTRCRGRSGNGSPWTRGRAAAIAAARARTTTAKMSTAKTEQAGLLPLPRAAAIGTTRTALAPAAAGPGWARSRPPQPRQPTRVGTTHGKTRTEGCPAKSICRTS